MMTPRFRTLSISLLALCLILAGVLVPAARPVQASVTLITFTATAGDGQVFLHWETATEIDNAGFYIRSSTQQAGPYVRVSPFIQAQGDGVTGWIYNWTNKDLTNGVTYYYELESITNSLVSELTDPISATPQGPTPTQTPTPSATPTPTRTPLVSATFTPTPTSTRTQAASRTPTSTSLFNHTPTPTSTDSGAIATATRTSTTIPTRTPTSTTNAYPGPENSTRTLVPTFTRSPTSQAVLAPSATSAPDQAGTTTTEPDATQVAQASGALGASGEGPTLVPFPTVTVIFPQATAVSRLESVQRQSGSAVMDKPQRSNPGSRYLPLAFVLLIWVLLGGWFLYSMRRME